MSQSSDPTFPGGAGWWVLLSYRLPREPSTPRIAVWRKLKRLGVAQLGDGLVALPADARTREQLEWIAEEITEFGGTAGVWLARPGTARQERELAAGMAAARAAEYAAVLTEAGAATTAGTAERTRTVRRLRAELRRIAQRDYFPPTERDAARAAVAALAQTAPEDQDPDQPDPGQVEPGQLNAGRPGIGRPGIGHLRDGEGEV